MPRVSAPSQQTVLRNHPSWECDDDAKWALGPVIAEWLASGVLESVAWNDRLPILLQPCGAVPKGTAPFYQLITDARFANKLYSDWGVTYTTAAQLSSTLNRCYFQFSIDISTWRFGLGAEASYALSGGRSSRSEGRVSPTR
jgi:hypothetical protein